MSSGRYSSVREERIEPVERKKSVSFDIGIADEQQPEYLDRTMKKSLRWLTLMLACLFVVPNYFCYDNPAAVETYIESEFGKTPS